MKTTPHKIYSLSVLDWSGHGGHHCQGTIYTDDPLIGRSIELERRLTLKEAKAISETKERLWFCHERTTTKFEDRASLERAAIKWMKANAKEPNWLLQYNSACNPERVIAAKGFYLERVQALNALADLWDKVPNHLRDGDVWDSTYACYKKLINPPESP